MKTRILRLSLTLFLNNGIRNISMDDIANEVGISKRTLYENFPSKHALLEECIAIYFMKRSFTPLSYYKNESINSLDMIVTIYHYYFLTTHETNPTCLKDLRKYYPSLFNQTKLNREQVVDQLLSKLSVDRHKGLIRSNIQEPMVSFFYKDFLYILFESENSFNQIERRSLLPELLIHFTKGICTPKGIKYFDKSLQKR